MFREIVSKQKVYLLTYLTQHNSQLLPSKKKGSDPHALVCSLNTLLVPFQIKNKNYIFLHVVSILLIS
jgi:hypothetical protein